MVDRRVYVVKNPSNLHPNGLAATADHLREAHNEPIVRAVSEVAIQSTLLCVNAQDVDILTTGTSRMGQQLRVRDKQLVPKGRPEFGWGHGQSLCLGNCCSRLWALPALVYRVVNNVVRSKQGFYPAGP